MNDASKIKPKIIIAMSELFTLLGPAEERRHLDFGRIAEDAGIDGLFVSEHVVMGPSSCYLGPPENPREFVTPGHQDPRTPWPSPLIKLAALAGATQDIRLLSCALIAPFRHPILLAKDIATLETISNGRLTILPSVSWQQEEYTALEIPWHERGARLDEHLQIWKLLWKESPTSFSGRFYKFQETYFEPKPQTDPRIWIGGSALTSKVIERISKYGSGFFPAFVPSDADWQILNGIIRDSKCDAGDFEITGWLLPHFPNAHTVASIDEAIDRIPAMVSLGYNTIAIKPSCFIDDPNNFKDLCRRIVRRVSDMFA